ncbi:hypothetical protein ABRY23_01875 [Melioribacteraceae bacterium 4301-Me]|uniref:TolB family protein n=1 Tax=Pyranulibacter aquaticus TaxID=3163344 RepID=UPI0035982D37
MNTKIAFSFIATFIINILVLNAQVNISQRQINSDSKLSVGTPQKLILPDSQYYMSPSWSPDGNYLAYTSSNYKGIWVMNLATNEARQITDEIAAGFGFEWSPDSKVILTRVAKYEGVKRFNAVKLFFVESKEEKLLTNYRTFMPSLPHWSPNGENVYFYNGRELEIIPSGISVNSLKKNTIQQKMAYSKKNKIYVGDSIQQSFNSFEPFKDREYLNITTSPDGLKIAFEVYGGNLYVMNSDGTGLIDLGKGYRPKWSPDSKRIVYMISEDDGYNYTSSDLYVINADGTNKIQLTKTKDELEMDPSWSPDGKYIVYNEMNEGAIYILPVNIQ